MSITSNNFDETTCIDLVKRHKIVISIHWLSSSKEEIQIWWKNSKLRKKLTDKLRNIWFSVANFENNKFQWILDTNICNKWNSSDWWVQIEISRGYRNKMLENKDFLDKFVETIRKVLVNYR